MEKIKVNAGPALAAALTGAAKGYSAFTGLLTEHKVKEKMDKATTPVIEQATLHKELLLSLTGVALILHGSQFKNLMLCGQVFKTFFYDRVKTAVSATLEDLDTAQKKIQADAPAAKPEAPAKNKADAKKKAEAAKQQNLDVAKKVLKLLDSERFASTTGELLMAGLVCLLVMHGGLPQAVVVTFALVKFLANHVQSVIEFGAFEELEKWNTMLIKFILWLVLLPLSRCSVALALNASILGATLALKNGCCVAEQFGKLEKTEEFLASRQGLTALFGLVGVGTALNLWGFASGVGMAWYFRIVYCPAVFAESFLSVL